MDINTTKLEIPDSNQFADRIPLALLMSSNPFDAKLYTYLVSLAKLSNREEFTMPPIPDMLQVLDVSYHKLKASLTRLHESGWIIRTNLDMTKHVRFRTIVKYVKLELEIKLNEQHHAAELYSKENLLAIIKQAITETKQSEGKTPDNSDSCPIIYTQQSSPAPEAPPNFRFSPGLAAVKKSATKKDINGMSLADYSDKKLYDWSYGASEEDIEHAICEVIEFKKGKQVPRDMKIIYMSRFVQGADGRGILNPERKGQSKRIAPAQIPNVQARQPEGSLSNELPAGCQIYPTPIFRADRIDRVCERLNCRESIEKADLPAYLFPTKTEWLQGDGEEHRHRVKLNECCELVQLQPGYWKICWLELSHVETRRASLKPVEFKDGVQVKHESHVAISDTFAKIREQLDITEEVEG